ncbi:hypothetical protein ACM66B_006278 [Microbotryomycetes sp. NB124-2]
MDHRTRLELFEQALAATVHASNRLPLAGDGSAASNGSIDASDNVKRGRSSAVDRAERDDSAARTMTTMTTEQQHNAHLKARNSQNNATTTRTYDDRAQKRVRQLCLMGIPDQPRHIRPSSYLVLLDLEPAQTLARQYSTFVKEVSSRVERAPRPDANDDKLSKEDKMLVQIHRDVERTFGGLAFFGQPPSSRGQAQSSIDDDNLPGRVLWDRLDMLDKVESARAATMRDSAADQTPPPPTTTTTKRPQTRRELLLRPLFVFATLNPGLGYVQGINSLIAVLTWIFSSSSDDDDSLESEACAFFALGAILSQLRDLYVPSLDATTRHAPEDVSSVAPPTGLGATLARYSSLLGWLDPDVAAHLQSKNVDPALYCFRWLTTLFANEFHLPDLVRIWDRVLSLYPSDTDPRSSEALSPILGHLIDISLAIVLMDRRTIVSPYSTFSKLVQRLQEPQIESERVDQLLEMAWDIRNRRLGLGPSMSEARFAGASETERKRSSVDASTWMSAASKWAAAATAKASLASQNSTGSTFKSRFWSTQSSLTNGTQRSSVAPGQVADFELDETASVDGSDAGSTVSTPAVDARNVPRRSEAGLDGKVTLAELIEAEMPRDTYNDDNDDDSYALDNDLEGDQPTLKERAANSWKRLASSDAAAALSKTATNLQIKASMQASNLKESASKSDAAASLSKTTTNLTIQAQLLKDQIAQQGPEKLATIKETVSGASGRLMASTGSASSDPRGLARRPGSPVEEPFTPPRWSMRAGPGTIRRPPSPPPFVTPDGHRGSGGGGEAMQKTWSGGSGPKPLLLGSGSTTRRLSNASDTSSSASPSVKRNSFVRLSPSTSPQLSRQTLPRSPDLSVPIGSALSRSGSRGSAHLHGRSASAGLSQTGLTPASSFHARSASTETRGLFAATSDDVPIQSLRISTRDQSDSLATSSRIKRPVAMRGPPPLSASSATPAADGRGWTLSDGPVSAPATSSTTFGEEDAFDPSRLTNSSSVGDDLEQPSLAPAEDDDGHVTYGTPMLGISPSISPGPSSSNSSIHTAPEEVPESVRAMFMQSEDVVDKEPLPPRRSSLGQTATTTNEATRPPPRGSSLSSNNVTTSVIDEHRTLTSLIDTSTTTNPETVDEDQPLSAGPSAIGSLGKSSINRGGIVRRPGAVKKRHSSSSRRFSGMSSSTMDDGASADDDGKRRSLVGPGYGVGGSAQRDSVSSQFSGGRNSVAWETGDFLEAYGGDGDDNEARDRAEVLQ